YSAGPDRIPPTMKRLFVPLLVLAATAPLSAQAAAFRVFGQPCSAPNEPVPAIRSSGLPRIGTSFDVVWAGPNRNANTAQQTVQPWLVTGFAALPAPAVIPAWLLPQQPAGCQLLVRPDVVVPMPLDSTGQQFENR